MEKTNPTVKIGDAPVIRIPAPVIVDLGSKKQKDINKLKNGQGKLMYDVEQALEQVRSGLPDADKDKQIIPVLVIYRKKRKRKCGPFPLSPLAPLNFLR